MENEKKIWLMESLLENDDKNLPRSEIFGDAAMQFAKRLYFDNMSRSQLRAFLRYLRAIEQSIRTQKQEGDFQQIARQLEELNTFVIYQSNRERQSYPNVFREFYEHYFVTIKTKKNNEEFLAFVKFVAAIFAYYTFCEKNKDIQEEKQKYKNEKKHQKEQIKKQKAQNRRRP